MEPKILVIDDDAVIRATVCAAFQGHVCRVLQAANGPTGLNLARRERPDVMLLDFDMPGMTGAEVLAEVRADADLRQLPVVMFTINSAREHVAQVLKLGVKDFLVKPATKATLLERLTRIVSLKPRPTAVTTLRRADGPLRILVVDDKPIILAQIRDALAQTSWTIQGVSEGEEAVAVCNRTVPDLILLSLSLPGGFGFTLFQILRNNPASKAVPILGLAVKTATRDQQRAQQLGFNGVITKPIDPLALAQRITRTLGLDTSRSYFEHRDDCLVVKLPGRLEGARAGQVNALLCDKICAEVDAGLRRAVIDFNDIKALDETLIKTAVRLIEFCQESELQFALIGPEPLREQCQAVQETKDWDFVSSFEAARAKMQAAAVSRDSEVEPEAQSVSVETLEEVRSAKLDLAQPAAAPTEQPRFQVE